LMARRLPHTPSAKGHHKDEKGNFILSLYYGFYPFFGYCCLSQEFFYLAKWALFFHPDLHVQAANHTVTLAEVAQWVFLPGLIAKQVVNAAQWWNAAGALAEGDRLERENKRG